MAGGIVTRVVVLNCPILGWYGGGVVLGRKINVRLGTVSFLPIESTYLLPYIM